MNRLFKTVELNITQPQNVVQSIQDAIKQIHNNLQIDPPVKVQLVALIKYNTANNEELNVYVSTTQQALNSYEKLNGVWAEEMMRNFEHAAETARMRGSGWTVGEVLSIELKETKFNPIIGRSYVPLPADVVAKRAVLNIQNTDDKCFMWCVLVLHHVSKNTESFKLLSIS